MTLYGIWLLDLTWYTGRVSVSVFVCVDVCACVCYQLLYYYSFFLHNSLLIHYCGSQLFYVRSNWNVVCRLDMPLVDSHLNFITNEWVVTSLWRHLSFLQTIFKISISIHTTNFILGTNISTSNSSSSSDFHRCWRSLVKVKCHKNMNKWSVFHPETSYLVPRHNIISSI